MNTKMREFFIPFVILNYLKGLDDIYCSSAVKYFGGICHSLTPFRIFLINNEVRRKWLNRKCAKDFGSFFQPHKKKRIARQVIRLFE